MPRIVSDADIRKALQDKQITPRAFRSARNSSPQPAPETETHPLVAQGKAVASLASEISTALKGQGSELARAITLLSKAVEGNNAMIVAMIEHMQIIHSQMGKLNIQPGPTPPAPQAKRKPWKATIIRSQYSELADHVRIEPVED